MRLHFLEISQYELEFRLKFCIFSMEIDRVIVVVVGPACYRNLDSNNESIEGRKSGNLTICSRILAGNIFPASRGQSS